MCFVYIKVLFPFLKKHEELFRQIMIKYLKTANRVSNGSYYFLDIVI